MTLRLASSVKKLAVYVILIMICLVIFIPLLITLFASFKSAMEIGSEFALKLPNSFDFDNYQVVLDKGKFLLGFGNSMFLVAVSVVINAMLGTTTAYAINRFDFRAKKIILALFVAGMIMPGMITEISRFTIINNLGLYNTIWAPVVIYAATNLVQLYIYTQFINGIPKELDESAMLDGCSYFGVFFRMIFPLLLPATATLAIIKAVDVMNDMYVPYLYMPAIELRTLTTTLMYFSSSKFGSWDYLSAAIILVMLPTLVIYLLFSKYIFKGIVAGAVKS
ncbi:carbohydrate ABC transporter permease [Paenibacillus marinisediminis]